MNGIWQVMTTWRGGSHNGDWYVYGSYKSQKDALAVAEKLRDEARHVKCFELPWST